MKVTDWNTGELSSYIPAPAPEGGSVQASGIVKQVSDWNTGELTDWPMAEYVQKEETHED